MITASINGVSMPPIELDFVRTPIPATADVVTLDNSMYTDFTALNAYSWTFNYDSVTKAEFDALKAVYDSQFTDSQYPLLTIAFYSITDQPARMYFNDQNIWDNCGDIKNLQIIFRETDQLTEVS